ncbi:MAG: hypothetical protein ACXQT3_03805, partial [Methermicoccaceae archaeon]
LGRLRLIKYRKTSYEGIEILCPICDEWGRLLSDGTDAWGDRRFKIVHPNKLHGKYHSIKDDHPLYREILAIWTKVRGMYEG